MDLESVAEELYGASPDEFIERRTQRVTEARAARERPLAKSISQLRRPTRSAWMVNLLAREAPEEVRQLLELGTALADAQQRAAGADLRRLSQQRHATLDALTRRATELASAAGHSATEASRQEVSQTLQAALADPAVAEVVRVGRVTQPVTYGGFGPLELFAVASPPPSWPTNETAEPAEPEPPEPAAPAEQHEEPAEDPDALLAEAAAREAAEAVEAVEAAEQEAAQSVDDAEQATRHADELADQVERLREQLAEAEAEEREARLVARAARRRAAQHQQALTEAQRALDQAKETLAEEGLAAVDVPG